VPKAKIKEEIINDLPELRSMDVNDMFEVMDELDCPIDMINERLILDGAFGYQYAAEGILNKAEFYDISTDEYAACEEGIRASMRAMNAVMRRMNLDYEIVEVDLADSMGFMLVAEGATPKQVAKNIAKGKI
jgi:hypothetical protein